MSQEVLLGGHLYLMVLKERLESFLRFVRSELEQRTRLSSDKLEGSNGRADVCTWQAAFLRLLCPSPSLPLLANIINKVLPIAPDVGRQMEYFLVTGNLRSSSGLSLQQVGTHPHGHTLHWTHPTLDTPHTGHTPHGHTPHWTHPTSVGSHSTCL